MQPLGSPCHTPPKAPQRESDCSLRSYMCKRRPWLAPQGNPAVLPLVLSIYSLLPLPHQTLLPSALTILLQPNYLRKLVSRNNFLLGTISRLCSHLSQCLSVRSTTVLTHSYLQTLPTFQHREYPLSWPTLLVLYPPPHSSSSLCSLTVVIPLRGLKSNKVGRGLSGNCKTCKTYLW